jgi:hypothetical protein
MLRGLDTETQNGLAVLIATPERYILFPRSFRRCVEFLEREKRYVCWNADYDAQAILKFLSKAQLEQLYHHGRITVRLSHRTLTVQYRRTKYLRVGELLRKRPQHKCNKACERNRHQRTRPLFCIYDMKQFHNMKLDRAAKRLLGAGKMELPDGWITDMRRRLEDPETRQVVIDYCMIDAKRCEQIATISEQNFKRIGIDFSRPISNASLAVQKFRKTLDKIQCPPRINKMARRSYRGGRIECLQLGYFPRAYYYDLNSAYPSAMAELPMMDGRWTAVPRSGPGDDAHYAVVQVDVEIPTSEYMGPIPVLPRHMMLIYPTGVWRTVVDLDTYRMIDRRGFVHRVIGGHQMVGGSGRRMLPELRAMYRERKANPENAWALKIVMNSLYGKFAQTTKRLHPSHIAGPGIEIVGDEFFRQEEHFERYTNFVIASAITAKIRRRIYEQLPAEDIIFIATDGVMLRRPTIADRYQGQKMGQWSPVERVRDLVVVGSGMYTYEKGGKRTTKMRGFDVDIDLLACLDTPRRTVRLDVRRNVTLAHAVIQKRKRDFNELLEVPRELDLNFDRKRQWNGPRSGRMLLTAQMQSLPWRYLGSVKVKR